MKDDYPFARDVNLSLFIDFLELSRQKRFLLELPRSYQEGFPEIEGLLGLIDAIESIAIDQGVPERIVYS